MYLYFHSSGVTDIEVGDWGTVEQLKGLGCGSAGVNVGDWGTVEQLKGLGCGSGGVAMVAIHFAGIHGCGSTYFFRWSILIFSMIFPFP